jgi:hypothetical protein
MSLEDALGNKRVLFVDKERMLNLTGRPRALGMWEIMQEGNVTSSGVAVLIPFDFQPFPTKGS